LVRRRTLHLRRSVVAEGALDRGADVDGAVEILLCGALAAP
jgi:hypothetical protein